MPLGINFVGIVVILVIHKNEVAQNLEVVNGLVRGITKLNKFLVSEKVWGFLF